MRKLQMDFQPLFMAGNNLRKADKSRWPNVRDQVVPKKNPTCSICGYVAETDRSFIDADEVWEFPEPSTVILADVRPLCKNCHDAKDYADLIRRIGQGINSASRSLTVIAHYCAVNQCTHEEFDADFKEALATRAQIETAYRFNCDKKITVNFGKWGRQKNKPVLTSKQRGLIINLYHERDEPIEANGKSFSTLGTAVKYLQSLTVDARDAVIAEMKAYVEEENDSDEPLREADEGVQFL